MITKFIATVRGWVCSGCRSGTNHCYGNALCFCRMCGGQ
jgi:hypothetical protein